MAARLVEEIADGRTERPGQDEGDPEQQHGAVFDQSQWGWRRYRLSFWRHRRYPATKRRRQRQLRR
jgi:hypothetical protein